LVTIVFCLSAFEAQAGRVTFPVTLEVDGTQHAAEASYSTESPGLIEVQSTNPDFVFSRKLKSAEATQLAEIHTQAEGGWRHASDFRNTPVFFPVQFPDPKPRVVFQANAFVRIEVEGKLSRGPWNSTRTFELGKDPLERGEAGVRANRIVLFGAGPNEKQALFYLGLDGYGRPIAASPHELKEFKEGTLSALPLYSLSGAQWRYVGAEAFIKAFSPGMAGELQARRVGSMGKSDLRDGPTRMMAELKLWLASPASLFPRKRSTCEIVTGILPPEGLDPNAN